MKDLGKINVDEDIATKGYVDSAIPDISSIEANVIEIKTSTDKIGATGDTGGTSSAGTVMAKSNKIITDVGTVSTNVSTANTNIGTSSATASASGTSLFALLKYLTEWATSARGTKIDNIGATGDTGGSASAGTVMGKLNKVITDVGSLDISPSISHTVWQSSYKKFSTQYNISSTNTGSSSTEKCYYYKIGSISFSPTGATDLYVNMVTTGTELNDTLNANNATVELYISTSNYSSGSTLANRTTISNNSIWKNTLSLNASGTNQEFIMLNNRNWAAGTTYYVYVAVHATLPASTGQIKLKTPLIDFQCFYTTGSTTTNTGLRKRIIARAKIINSAYLSHGKHVYEMESMVTSDTNCKIYYPYRYAGGDTQVLIIPVIAGNYIRFMSASTTIANAYGLKNTAAAYQMNTHVGPYAIIEEYY